MKSICKDLLFLTIWSISELSTLNYASLILVEAGACFYVDIIIIRRLRGDDN